MDIQMKRILNKLYQWENEYYGENGDPLYAEKALTEKEREVLSARRWEPNRIETFSGHVEILEKLHSLKQNPHLSESRIMAAFVAGVGGSYLRGRSALSAWNCFHTIPPHDYQSLRQKAVKAIDAVISNHSELKELWEENEELYRSWREDKVLIQERLRQ